MDQVLSEYDKGHAELKAKRDDEATEMRPDQVAEARPHPAPPAEPPALVFVRIKEGKSELVPRRG